MPAGEEDDRRRLVDRASAHRPTIATVRSADIGAKIETPSAFEDAANEIEDGEEGRLLTRAHLVHQLLPGSKTKLADLHLLCANCHRMIHAGRPWLTLGQLRACIST
jgi:hypothetical protein